MVTHILVSAFTAVDTYKTALRVEREAAEEGETGLPPLAPTRSPTWRRP